MQELRAAVTTAVLGLVLVLGAEAVAGRVECDGWSCLGWSVLALYGGPPLAVLVLWGLLRVAGVPSALLVSLGSLLVTYVVMTVAPVGGPLLAVTAALAAAGWTAVLTRAPPLTAALVVAALAGVLGLHGALQRESFDDQDAARIAAPGTDVWVVDDAPWEYGATLPGQGVVRALSDAGHRRIALASTPATGPALRGCPPGVAQALATRGSATCTPVQDDVVRVRVQLAESYATVRDRTVLVLEPVTGPFVGDDEAVALLRGAQRLSAEQAVDRARY